MIPLASLKIARRKEGEKEKRRREILHRAKSLFVKLGYHETTIELIAQDASLGKGTVYYYYQNKEQILGDVLMEGIRAQKRKIYQELKSVGSFVEMTRTISTMALSFLMDHLEYLHALQREGDKFRSKCPAIFGDLIKEMTVGKKLFIRLVKRRGEREGVNADPEIIYDLISNQVIGYAHHFYQHKKDKASLHAKLDASLDIIHRGLFDLARQTDPSIVFAPSQN